MEQLPLVRDCNRRPRTLKSVYNTPTRPQAPSIPHFAVERETIVAIRREAYLHARRTAPRALTAARTRTRRLLLRASPQYDRFRGADGAVVESREEDSGRTGRAATQSCPSQRPQATAELSHSARIGRLKARGDALEREVREAEEAMMRTGLVQGSGIASPPAAREGAEMEAVLAAVERRVEELL